MSLASLSISMAAGTMPHSSSLCSKLSKQSFTTFSHAPLPTNHFRSKSKPIAPKPLTFNTHFPNFTSLSLPSQTHLCRALSSFDSSQDTTFTEEEEEEPTNSQEDTEAESESEEEEEEEKVEEEEKEVPESGGSGRLFVGNLPYSMSSSELAEIFGEAGKVVAVEIKYDRVTDRSRGFAFVTMEGLEEAKEAIRLFDGAQVGGRSVKVNFPEVPLGGERAVMKQQKRSSYEDFVDSPHKVYVGNLAWSLTSEALKEAFANQPGVLSAKIVYEKDSGRSRGFGFVSFDSAENAQSALTDMNGVEVQGRPLRLNTVKRNSYPDPPAVESSANKLDPSEVFSSISSGGV